METRLLTCVCQWPASGRFVFLHCFILYFLLLFMHYIDIEKYDVWCKALYFLPGASIISHAYMCIGGKFSARPSLLAITDQKLVLS